MSNLTGITYADAAILFKAANLPSSARHVRTMIWQTRDDKGKLICPVQDFGYHSKRVKGLDVEKLIKHLVKTARPSSKVYPGQLPPADTAAARLANLTKGKR